MSRRVVVILGNPDLGVSAEKRSGLITRMSSLGATAR